MWTLSLSSPSESATRMRAIATELPRANERRSSSSDYVPLLSPRELRVLLFGASFQPASMVAMGWSIRIGRVSVRGYSVTFHLEAAREERWAQFAGRHGDPGRAMALYVARRCTGLTLRALGKAAGGGGLHGGEYGGEAVRRALDPGQNPAPDDGPFIGGGLGENECEM